MDRHYTLVVYKCETIKWLDSFLAFVQLAVSLLSSFLAHWNISLLLSLSCSPFSAYTSDLQLLEKAQSQLFNVNIQFTPTAFSAYMTPLQLTSCFEFIHSKWHWFPSGLPLQLTTLAQFLTLSFQPLSALLTISFLSSLLILFLTILFTSLSFHAVLLLSLVTF